MSEQTVAFYLTKTEVGDIKNGLVALSDIVDTAMVPRIAYLREQFRERYKGFDLCPSSQDQISFCRPEGMDACGLDDEKGSYIAMTVECYADIERQMRERVNLLAENKSLAADGRRIAEGWTESQKEVRRLIDELSEYRRQREFYFDQMLDRDKIIKNLEAQRDILIRALGDLGNMVK